VLRDEKASNSIVCWWWLGLEGFVPPPVGAFAGGSGAGWDGGRGMLGGAGDRSCSEPSAVTVGDDEVVGGAGDGDQAGVPGGGIESLSILQTKLVSSINAADAHPLDPLLGLDFCGVLGDALCDEWGSARRLSCVA
jgi:hypothetical protein